MSRYTDNHTGTHVYDTDTDQWYRIEDDAERESFLNYAESTEPTPGAPAPIPVLMVVQPQDDTITEERGAPTYATFNVGLSTVGVPSVVLGSDINRREVRLKFISTAGTIIIGRKEMVMQGQGYVMSNGDKETLETTDELWCAGFTALTAAVLSVLVITNTTH